MQKISLKIPKGFEKIDFGKSIRNTIGIFTNKMRNQVAINAPFKNGTLRKSIQSHIFDNGMSSEIGTNLVYAPIQEFGGIIRPKSKKYLTFKINGRFVRTKKSVIKGKKYFQRAIKKYDKNEFSKILNKELEIYLSKLT